MTKNSVVYLAGLIQQYGLCLADVDFLVRQGHLQRINRNGRASYIVLTDVFEEYI